MTVAVKTPEFELLPIVPALSQPGS